MSIVSFNTLTPGLIGVTPRVVQITATDNLATITTAGYLNANGQVLQGFAFYPTDILFVIYSYVASSNSGTFAMFTPSIAPNGTITLVQWVNSGDVLLPVVSGDFAVFNGTTGQIKDAGYLPSNAAKTNVVMANAATVANNLVKATDTAGTIGDAGIAAANVQLNTNIKANAVSWAGGSASHGFTITGITSSSIVIPSIQAQATGTVYIESYTVGTNTLTVTFSADPGAMVLQYVAFIAAQ